MYIRLTYFKVAPEKLAEVKKIYNKEVVPVVKKQKGNLGIYLMEPVDKADDLISITEWKSKNDADAYAASKYNDLVKKVESFFTKTPVLKIYNVEKTMEPVI